MSDFLKGAYDAENFRRKGHELVDMLADYLQNATSGAEELKVLNYQPADEQYQFWEQDYKNNDKDFLALMNKVLDRSIHIHHPKYMGHQVTAPLPEAALAGLLTNLLNNGMAVYEMGPAASALDQFIGKLVAKKAGFGEQGGGILTSGGTLANLTALLAARSIQTGKTVWEEGSRQPLALMVSEEAHYCVDRAARIMGWGNQGVIKVPVDENYRMRTDLLEEYYQKAEAQGVKVIAIVGSACSTSTGKYDRLDQIADFAEKHQLWFHVDGAHGGGAIYSEKYSPLLKGIERADTVTIDFHKMLMTPALSSVLLFKNEEHSFATFAQKAQYLWDKSGEWENLAGRTFECTKFMMSVKVYSILRTYGEDIFAEYTNVLYDLGKSFAGIIDQHAEMELPYEPDSNIVCFRYRPEGLDAEQTNQLNAQIRQQLLEEGTFYIVQTQLQGNTYLRTTLMNPFTGPKELEELLVLVKTTGQKIAEAYV